MHRALCGGAALVLLIGVFLAVPGGADSAPLVPEVELSAGSFVQAGSPELPRDLRALGADAAVCLAAAANGVYLVPFSPCPETLSVAAVRLVAAAGREPGSQVKASETDHGAALVAPGGLNFTFLPRPDTAAFGYGATAYLAYCMPEACSVPGETVQEGWIRLTQHGDLAAGSSVAGDDPDHSEETLQVGTQFTSPLAKGAAHLRYWDVDGDGAYGLGDALYWRAAGTSNDAAPGWIRLTAAPGADALTVVAAGGREVPPGSLKSLSAVAFCYLDLDENGQVSNEDPIYLIPASSCPSRPPVHALRLTGTDNHPAGSFVQQYDWDRHRDLSALNGTAIVYVDRDESGGFTTADALYLLLCDTPGCPDDWFVRHGTLRLSDSPGGSGGTRVSGADTDFFDRVARSGAAFEDPFAAGRFAFWSTSGSSTFSTADVLYWRSGALGNAPPGIGAVRVSPFPDGAAMGGVLDGTSPEVTASLIATEPKPKAVCRESEAVYVVLGDCMDGVTPGSIRLVEMAGKPAGTIVRAGDADDGRSIANATESAGFRGIAAGSPGALESTEAIYLCLDDAGCPEGGTREVQAGWVRLAPSAYGAAGTLVAAGDGDVGAQATNPSFIQAAASRKNLTAVLEHQWVYWDLDGSGTPTPGDVVYLRMKGEVARPAAGDLRLTSAHMAMPASWFPQLIGVQAPGMESPVDPPAPKAPRQPLEDDVLTTPDAAPGDDDEELVPGVWPLAPIVAVFLLLAARRRRVQRAASR